jgi:hypothetical protein
LVGRDSANALNALLERSDFILMEFFLTFCWPPNRSLRDAQERIVAELTEDAMGIASVPWNRSVLFSLTTGGGKSIAVDFLVAAMSMTHMYTESSTNAVRGVVIVAVPTIALATETHIRLQQTWLAYSNARYDVGEHPMMHKFPPIHTYKSGGSLRPYPLVKLLAGANSAENLFLTIRETGDATREATLTHKIPFVIVATYEHALGLVHKWSDTVGTGFTTTYGHHIKCLIMDEAHYATESDRPAPRALVKWARYRNLFTVFLTGTPTAHMHSLFDLRPERTFSLVNQRAHDKVVVPLTVFPNDVFLVNATVPFVVGGWMRSLMTERRKRMAVFVENKVTLKILLCVLYHKLIACSSELLPSIDPRVSHPRYVYLRQAMSVDPAVLCDTTPYGAILSSEYTVSFTAAYTFLASIGVLMVTADFGGLTRRNLTAILSTPDIPYSVVLTTSALAEGVNMCFLHTAYIATVARKHNTGGSIVKIVQELGRQDREDTGGATYVPKADEIPYAEPNMPALVMTTDLFGRNINKDVLLRFLASEGESATLETCDTVFDEATLLRTYLDADWARLISRVEVSLKGYQYMPYYHRHSYLTIPSLYVVGDVIMPCLMLRVLRLFRQGNNFNMQVMSLSVETINALQIFPCATQILLITILLQMKQYRSHNDIQTARNKSFNAFIQERRYMLEAEPFTQRFLGDMDVACKHVAIELKSTHVKPIEYAGLVMRRPIIEELHVLAIATYLTEITLCVEGWDYITAEWTAYDTMFAGTMNNFDAFVDILTDDPIFPVLQAQRDHIRACGKQHPDMASTCTQLRSMISTPSVALWTLGDFHPEVLCSTPMESAVRINSFNNTPEGPRLAVVAENPLLLLLSHAAGILHTVFQLSDTQSFANARDMSTNNATRSLSANIDRVLWECNTGEGMLRCMAVDAYSRIIETPYTIMDSQIHETLESIRITREVGAS